MLNAHREIILSNLSALVEQTNLETLVPELLRRGVFNELMINRILTGSQTEKLQKTDLYLEILKRGPEAFASLEDALSSSNHLDLAEALAMANRSSAQQSALIPDLLGSGADDAHESDGPLHSSQGRSPSASNALPRRPDSFPQDFPATSSGLQAHNHENGPTRNSHFQSFRDPSSRVFAPPKYEMEDFGDNLATSAGFSSGMLFHPAVRCEAVNVKNAAHWPIQEVGKPGHYKMDSNPRGCALIINNKNFSDSEEYPERLGSENDMYRMTQLLQKLHFSVEPHENKTKKEMVDIVTKFSERPDLKEADCIWVTIMSHGEEGENSENSLIVGTDGEGYKTQDLISRFFNDSCIAAVDKPKLFFLQSCRGCLTDPGVEVDLNDLQLRYRVAVDGRRVRPPQRREKIRTQSDIFVVYPVPDGHMANRDILTGAWFIQAVVDIFSANAHNTDLEDMLKMVDTSIKEKNNLNIPNFQTVTVKSIGWNKKLFFNPGLCRDKLTGATCHIGNSVLTPQLDEGMDVVDQSSTNSDKSPNGAAYLRFDEDKDSDSESHGKGGCFDIRSCKTS